jgi:hypothetical protein
MIRITVTLVPGGDESRAREVARADVANISCLADLSDYDVVASEVASDVSGLPAQTASFKIFGHARRQSVWSLVTLVAMRAAGRFNRGAGEPAPEHHGGK